MSGSLDHSPSQIIQQLLVDLGLGTAPASAGSWPVFYSQEPDGPDSCITVFDMTQVQDGRVMVTGEMQEHYGIQVRIRAATHALAHAKADAIALAMDQSVLRDAVTIAGSVYVVQSISRRSGPFDIGEESPTSKRRVFTINLIVSMRQTS